MRAWLGMLIAFAALSGCMTLQNADAPPGETMRREDVAVSWFPAGLSGGKSGITHWTRFRVIAPEGATECRSGSLSPLINAGPQASGRPNSKGEVMLTTDPDSLTVHVRCSMPQGDIVRSVDGYRFEKYYRMIDRTSGFNIQPPLIHMDPTDPQIEARWAGVREEVCKEGEIGPRAGYLCQPEIFAALKAADMGVAAK